jgi:hypothetical protein
VQHSERQVEIEEIVSNVRVFDSGAALNPHTLQTIVTAVLRAVDERERYRERIRAERQITSGVRDELEGEA